MIECDLAKVDTRVWFSSSAPLNQSRLKPTFLFYNLGMIAAIIVVPLIFFFNAFFIGRIMKKVRINVNPFLATLIGLIAYFDVFYFISVWMYAGRAIIWSYFVVFGAIQLILLAIYIANWRYAFITWSVNYKKVLTFLIAFGMTIVIGYLCYRNFNSEFGRNWYKTIEALQYDIWKPIRLQLDSANVVSNFSIVNVFNTFWINAFSIKNSQDALTYCNWSWTIIAAGFVGCLCAWLYGKNTSIPRMLISIGIVLVFVVLTLAFIESYAVGDAWILLLLFAFVLILAREGKALTLWLFMLTTLLIGFVAMSCTSYFTVLCVWIFSTYYAIRNKKNSFNFILFMSWPLLLAIASMLSIYHYTYWLLSVINLLYLIFALILIMVYQKFGTPGWDTKIALGIYHNSGRIVYAGLVILIALILVANFFIFQEIYKWKAENINYRNFLTFTYTYIWSFNITSAVNVAIFNTLMYALFLALTLTYLIVRATKKSQLAIMFKTDSVIKFGIVSCILFINPLVIHMLKISTQNFPLNTLDLNMLFVIPIFIVALKATFNYKKDQIGNWKYNWY